MWHTAGRRKMCMGLDWENGIKRPLGRPRQRWEDNTKMYDQEIGCRLNSTGSKEGLVEGSTEHSSELLGFKKC
jgi:hypothetical protein